MNKIIKILLSVTIVSLSALIILNKNNESIETEVIEVHNTVTKSTKNNISEFTEISIPINFEIDKTIEEMNQRMVEIESITDQKEWFIAYKNIINDYSYILDPPETIYDCFTDEELDLLFCVTQAEVGDEYSFESKTNVVSVIFNRLYDERFPNTLSEILTEDQFSTISNGRYKEVVVSEETIIACEYVFMIGDTTDGCIFFEGKNSNLHESYATFLFQDESGHKFYK